MTTTHQTTPGRWMLPFLAALVAVLATLLSSASASAATTGIAETRVRASASVGDVLVEPPQRISAGQRLGNSVAGHQIVVATGVAANGAAPRFIGNSAGDILDTTRVTIPEGKFGYLLKNPS